MTDTQRRWLKGIALFSISFGLLAYVVSRVDLPTVWRILTNADPALLAVAFTFSATAFACLPTLRWRTTLQAMGYDLPFKKLVYVRFGAQPFKFTIPLKGGEAFRAIYLRRRHGVPMTAGVASILFDMFLVAVGQLTFLCVGVALAGSAVQRALLPTVALFGIGLLLSSKRVQGWAVSVAGMISSKLHQKVSELAHGFLRFPLHKKLQLTAISFAVEFAEIFSMYLCCLTLGLDVPLWAAMAYMPIVMGFTLIPVTIRGLGTRELAILLLFAGLATPEELAGAALLFTVLEFIMPAIIGSLLLSRFVADLAEEPVEASPHDPPNTPPGPLWLFLAENKRWWLLPAAIVFAVFALMMLLTATGDVAPFVY